MLGLSLTKILFTVLVIVAVWRAFALVGQLQALRQKTLAPRGGNKPGGNVPGPAAVDLVPCPACGAYVPRGETCRCRQG